MNKCVSVLIYTQHMAANIIEHKDKSQRCLTAGKGISTQISCTLIYNFFASNHATNLHW